MRASIIFIIPIILISITGIYGQEFRFDVQIQAPRLQVTDQRVLTSLENQVREFMNTKRWTRLNYKDHEKIKGNINITITQDLENSVFTAEMVIQAVRPVFNSNYKSTLLNHNDRQLSFAFDESTPLVYTENNFNDNLTSILAFYAYYILGLDGDTFSLYGGDPYYNTAKDIINVLPPGYLSDDQSGWNNEDVSPNRYYMLDNMLSPKARPFRKALYEYHRRGLDVLADNPDDGKKVILDALKDIETVNSSFPRPMVITMFANAKAEEIANVFSFADRNEKTEAYRIMTSVDPANRNKYAGIRR